MPGTLLADPKRPLASAADGPHGRQEGEPRLPELGEVHQLVLGAGRRDCPGLSGTGLGDGEGPRDQGQAPVLRDLAHGLDDLQAALDVPAHEVGVVLVDANERLLEQLGSFTNRQK